METSNQIAQVTHNLTTAEDGRDVTKILMQPYANWEEYLTPAPVSIAILGELVFISSNTDFSIRAGGPEDGFKFIKYPDSFRACLMQVCNSGWRAFNEAHKNMDQIRLHTANVPTYIKVAVKILLQEDDTLVEALLPDQLANIRHIADDCLQMSQSTEKRFTEVIELIQELLETCTSAKQAYGKEMEEVRKKIEESKLRKEASEKANQLAKKGMESLRKQLDEAQKSFTESMNSMPSGWDVLGMNFVEGITESFSSLLSGVTNIATGKVFTSLFEKGNESPHGTAIKNDPIVANNIYAKSSQILKLVEHMNAFIEKDEIKWSEVIDQQSNEPKTNWQKKQLEGIKQSIQKENECEEKKLALELCTNAVNFYSEVAAHAPNAEPGDAKTKEIVQAFQSLRDTAQAFDTKSKAVTNASAFPVKPPQISQAQTSEPGSKTAGQIAVENARFKIEQSRIQLDRIRETYDKSVANMEKNQNELTEILITMKNCNIKEIDFQTTIKILAQGLQAMGQVKDQWQKLVRFFQMVANIISTCLDTSLKDFVQTEEKALTKKLKYSSRKFLKDMIYSQAFQASNIASLVHMISGTYTEVSDKYLMDRVSSLSRLIALDPTDKMFSNERMQMQNACEEAQEGIRALVLKNKKDFDWKTKSRLAKIENELKAVLPPESEEKKKERQERVAKEFQKENKAVSHFA